MLFISAIYMIAIIASPLVLAMSWWGWFHNPRIRSPRLRTGLYLSGLCAGTANFVIWWLWVAWLKVHYTPAAMKTRDLVSDAGLLLLLYSIIAVVAGKGRYRPLLVLGGILALVPWIPLGVL